MDPEALYLQLGQLISEMPELGGGAPITPEVNRWLGRAAYLVTEAGVGGDSISFTVASDLLNTVLREQNANQIRGIVFRALAFAEGRAPASARGGFVGIGQGLDALQVDGQVLAEARRDILIVDPYMDHKALTDFGPTAPSGVALRLLADGSSTKVESVKPAMIRWRQQFGAARPLEVRLSAPRALHDRLIFVDGSKVWSLTQSLKDLAARSPALVQRLDPDPASMKVDFYEVIWAASAAVT
jgi:hypothetical protein